MQNFIDQLCVCKSDDRFGLLPYIIDFPFLAKQDINVPGNVFTTDRQSQICPIM